jgi:hypothetical protein
MSNTTILAAIDTLVATTVTALATLASAQSTVTTLKASLATAQATLAADLTDSTTDSATLAARIPSESALVQVYETQLVAAQAAVVVAQNAVYTAALVAGTNAQSVARQLRSFQRSADESTLLSFCDPGKLRLGSVAIFDVLNASAADSTIAGYYSQFSTQDAALIPQNYPHIVNLSANWNTFKTAFNAVVGCTLVATN